MKNLYTIIVLMFLAVGFVGCGNDNRQNNPYIMGQKRVSESKAYVLKEKKDSGITIAKIEAEAKKEVAKINKERDLELKKMEENTKVLELKTSNEMAIKEHNLSTYVQESEFAFKNTTLIFVAIGLFAILALTLFIYRKRREDKLKMHEDNLQKEVYLREKELQVKMAEKILDTIATGKLSEEKEQHLLEALDKTTTATPTLPHKK